MNVPGQSFLYNQPLYDTMQLVVAAGGQALNFFTIPFGGALTAAANKTLAHTNLRQAGRLEAGMSFKMTGMTLHVRDIASGGARVTFVDYVNVFSETFIELFIGEVSFLQAPAYLVPSAAAEIEYFSNIAAAATEFKAHHGVASVVNQFHFGNNPHFLAPQESLRVNLTLGAAIAAVTDVTIVIWGEMTRPVR